MKRLTFQKFQDNWNFYTSWQFIFHYKHVFWTYRKNENNPEKIKRRNKIKTPKNYSESIFKKQFTRFVTILALFLYYQRQYFPVTCYVTSSVSSNFFFSYLPLGVCMGKINQNSVERSWYNFNSQKMKFSFLPPLTAMVSKKNLQRALMISVDKIQFQVICRVPSCM